MEDSGSTTLRERINGELRDRLSRLAPHTGRFTSAVPGLEMTRFDEPVQSESCFYEPAIGVVVQGSKKAVMGSEERRYGAGYCLVNGVDIPSVNSIVGASRDTPFLAVSLAIDRALATELNAEMEDDVAFSPPSFTGIAVFEAETEVLDAFLRLVRVLDQPKQLPLLAPLMVREIHFRILNGPNGGCLRMVSTAGSPSNQIATAVTWLRENFVNPVRVNELANRLDMGISTFHRHFKRITSLSPLEYQKRLRLYEAQRLMLASDKDATSASLAVGYESPTQFNREYKRLFGEPPHRDIKRLRQEQALTRM